MLRAWCTKFSILHSSHSQRQIAGSSWCCWLTESNSGVEVKAVSQLQKTQKLATLSNNIITYTLASEQFWSNHANMQASYLISEKYKPPPDKRKVATITLLFRPFDPGSCHHCVKCANFTLLLFRISHPTQCFLCICQLSWIYLTAHATHPQEEHFQAGRFAVWLTRWQSIILLGLNEMTG